MQIEITNVGAVYTDKKLEKMELHYNRDGKPTKRLLVNVADSKEVFGKLRGAAVGDKYEIDLKKDGEFWNWVGANKISSDYTTTAPGSTSAPKAAGTTVKSTYETSEERAARQILIVRQSSLSSAITVALSRGDQSTAGIIAIAKQFESYVFEKATEEIKDDIPYAQ